MRVDDFDFELPANLIADRPVSPRDSARLLHVGETLADHVMTDLPGLLAPGDLILFNDTRVIPAKLVGRRGAAKVEMLLHQAESGTTWRAFAKPAKRLKVGDDVVFAEDFSLRIKEKGEAGEILVEFAGDMAGLLAALEKYGQMPLPPYIKREAGSDARDRADYQTLFARHDGAVAAPTAALHFTPNLLAAFAARGVTLAPLTLHVGAGTFLPVRVERTEDHVMHSETGVCTPETVAAIEATKRAGGRVVCLGTTSLRLIESAAQDGKLKPFAGATRIFITPGYRFQVAERLITNFHLPRSTLFMLVSAFAGLERMRGAYDHAMAAGYRFYSYGDGSLLERAA